MRIAVLITGLYRQYFDYENNIKSMFDNSSDIAIDLFLTTWYDPLLINLNFSNYKIVDIESQSIYTSDIKNYETFLSFIKFYTNEDPHYKNYSLFGEDSGKINTPFIYYKLYRGLSIIKKYSHINNINYDLVLKTRTDFALENKFSEDYIRNLSDDGIYVKQIKYDTIKDFKCSQDYCMYTNEWVDDSFYFFKPNMIDKIKDIYNSYCSISIENNTWITHVINKIYFKKHGIKIYDHSFNAFLMRKNNQYIQPHFYLY